MTCGPGTVAPHCEGPARRELLGLVGHRPGSGGDRQGALGRPRRHRGRDHPTGPRHPAGPGRGRRRRRCRGRARRRRHAQRGGQRAGGHRHRPRRPARRLHQRVRPHPRPARRPHRGHRGAARRPRSRLGASGRPRVGERALLPLPRGHRVRRRRGQRGRAPGLAEALRQPPAVRLGRLRHLVAALRPPSPPLLGPGAGLDHGRRRSLHRLSQHQPLHLRRAPGPSTSPPRPPSTAPLPS